jgi:hypothetical protein
MGQGASVDNVEFHSKIVIHITDARNEHHTEEFNIDFAIDDLTVGGLITKLMESKDFKKMLKTFYDINPSNEKAVKHIGKIHVLDAEGNETTLKQMWEDKLQEHIDEDGSVPSLRFIGACC